MSLDEIDTVDAVGTDRASGTVLLSILDYWDWSDEVAHINRLQSKINRYLDFIGNGELLKAYPDAQGRKIGIDVITKHPLSEGAKQFLDRAAITLKASVVLTSRHVPVKTG